MRAIPSPDEWRRILREARRRPPRIEVAGEVSGEEALTLMQALGTGHEGSQVSCLANDHDRLRVTDDGVPPHRYQPKRRGKRH